MSADGRYVLVKGQGDDVLYRKDMATSTGEPGSVTQDGDFATGDSIQGLDISADGRFVLFTLDAYGDVNLDPNAPADQGNQTGPLFRKDMDTGAVVRVDVLSDGSYVTPMWGVGSAKMSADGNIVVFGHGNGEYAGLSADSWGAHVFHKNLTTGQLQVVDIQPDGSVSNNTAIFGQTYSCLLYTSPSPRDS